MFKLIDSRPAACKEGSQRLQTARPKTTEATCLPGQTDPVGQAWALPDLILRSELREGKFMVKLVIVA